MNDRQWYGRARRDGKETSLRRRFDNNKRIERELNAQTRDHFNVHYGAEVVAPSYIKSDYRIARDNRATN